MQPRSRAVRRVAAALFLALLAFAAAADAPARVDVYLFWADGCPHCEREIAFLKHAESGDERLRVHYLEVTRDAANRAAFVAVAEQLALTDLSVPLTFVGDAHMVGYDRDATTGAELKRLIDQCAARGCTDAVGPVLQRFARRDGAAPPVGPGARHAAIPQELSFPFVGTVRTADLSLPVLTVALAALDGFNPCAMWVLVFLIGLLLNLQDRLRMWTLGIAFIATSALVYFLFMAAWLNFLLFIGTVLWVRGAVGLVALAGGYYYLRQYFENPAAACEVTAPQARQRVFASLRRLASESRFWIALLGIVALAFAVNLVELVCSAGIPAVYTQVLSLSEIPRWQYTAYLALYILVFMLDDLFVFVVAMKTLQISGVTTRYTRFSHLAGGVVLLAIGALLLLRPQWLMFG